MNKNTLIYFILVLILVVLSFFAGRHSVQIPQISPVNDTIQTKIEKIIVKNDSLLRINDSINVKVFEIEKTYEKTVDDIIRNNTSDDYDFFSAYINRYRGSSNSDSIENR